MASAATAAPVNLTDWLAVGGGNWVREADNNGVKQTVNGLPAIFHNNENSQGKSLSGTIEVQTTSDDDFIGFVLGYNTGDLTNNDADYLLIDWKELTQNFFGTGLKGLAISRVTGPLGNNSGAWAHDPANNVTELARATNLGSTGWAPNTEYTFDLIFNSSLVEVFVNNVKELSVNGSFADGSFGFYNYSQAQVRYAGLQQDVLPPQPSAVPLPAALPALAAGIAFFGLMGWRRRQA
jgi:hypothetical protein